LLTVQRLADDAPPAYAGDGARIDPAVGGLRRRAATARRVFRAHGWRGPAFLALQRAGPRLRVHPEWFAVVEGRPPPAGGPAVPAGVRIARADDPGRLTGLGHPVDVLRERLDRGDVCVAAHDDQGLAGFAWYRLGGDYDEQGMLFRVRPGEAWAYDLMVAERRRGEGVSAAIVAAAAGLLGGHGVGRTVAAIDVVNAPALRGARSRGARELGRVAMVRAGALSVRREAWEGAPVRWSVCRGDRPARGPG
jgi:GNAT superfamily N-acetyltransferase